MQKYRIVRLGDTDIWHLQRQEMRGFWGFRRLMWIAKPYFDQQDWHGAEYDHESLLAATVDQERYERADRIECARKNNDWRRVN